MDHDIAKNKLNFVNSCCDGVNMFFFIIMFPSFQPLFFEEKVQWIDITLLFHASKPGLLHEQSSKISISKQMESQRYNKLLVSTVVTTLLLRKSCTIPFEFVTDNQLHHA